MDINIRTFLTALPAILGLTGFVVYQLLRSRGTGDPVVLRIVEKLRKAAPGKIASKGLSAEQVDHLLNADERLREIISNQDFQLLKQTLRQQFVTSIFVYSVCALLFAVGTYLYVRQGRTLEVSSIRINSTDPAADGLPVDIDDLAVTWKSSGEPEEVDVYLENPDGSQSDHQRVKSSQNRVVFCPRQYKQVQLNRAKGGANHIRAVLQSKSKVFVSDSVDLKVGIRIVAIAFPEKVKVAAMIDNHIIDYYSFAAKVLLPYKRPNLKPAVLGDKMNYGQTDFPVPDLNQVDWLDAKLVYFGPDDKRVVRSGFVVDSSLGAPNQVFESACGPE